ncbi:MAG: cobalt-precorrin 5A hydrolase [Oscillospiraceae bacterium]
MKIAVISITEKGRLLSRKITAFLNEKHSVERFCFHTHSDEIAHSFDDISSLTAKLFIGYDALIFVCACGIAVRSIAPHIVSKTCDPAVIVIDDCGKFAVPILSGHIGGANCLAGLISENIGAVPVITTATDVGGRFSPDSFAKANGLIITDINAAKEIAAAVLDGEKIGLCSDYPCENIPSEFLPDGACRTGICISADRSKKPFDVTLSLVPRNIIVGIGCKRNTSCDTIETHIVHCFETAGIDLDRLCAAATIDIKADEKGLIEFCQKYKINLLTFSADELMKVSGSFSCSGFVLEKTGTDNVCERNAVKAGGKLILPKTTGSGVTAALAEFPVTLDFERKVL